MNDAVKVLTALVGVAMVTTLVLPGRQTPAIVEKFFGGFSGTLKAATGR
jgi:hypothetical protein